MQMPPFLPPYPISAFPGLLGVTANSLSQGGAPDAIVGTTSIVFASMATQGTADCQWPNGHPLPIGANGLVIANSGTGKTLAQQIIGAPLYLWLERNQEESWVTALEDVTKEGLIDEISRHPIAGLITDEAAQLTRLLGASATLIKLLDGGRLINQRVSTGRKVLAGHRVSMLASTQWAPFLEMKDAWGIRPGGGGLINRFLVTPFANTSYSGGYHRLKLPDEIATEYSSRFLALLSQANEQAKKRVNRPVIPLSQGALKFIDRRNSEVTAFVRGQALDSLATEYVRRHLERTLRLSGVFHVFEAGPDGEISEETVARADSIASWHADAYAAMVNKPFTLSPLEMDANQLMTAVLSVPNARNIRQAKIADFKMFAYSQGIDPRQFPRVLCLLAKQGRVKMFRYRNSDWLEFSELPQITF